MTTAETALALRDVGRAYGERVALAGVTLELAAGATLAVFGANGAGKTTLLRILATLLRPQAGETHVLGCALPKEAWKARGRIGLLSHEPLLYRDLSARENLRFHARLHDVPAQRGDALLDAVGLAGRGDEPVRSLSRGMAQRVAICRAVLHEPELLLLDEPTSAVDPQSRRDFWESLFELVDRGTTILVSTHYMDEAERCHGLAILDRGQLVAEGSPRQLMDSIGATVIEIEADDVRGARHALDGQDFVKSVAQLGNRLHALLSKGRAQPEESIRALLAQHRVEGKVERVRASLEDVFVAATQF
jgi:ABC-2 type transport system ATP-binding protein